MVCWNRHAVPRAVLCHAMLLALSIAVAGCGGSGRPGTVAVTGKVTVNGQPVEGASVSFHPVEEQGTRHAHAVTKADGTFALTTFRQGDGAMPGTYDVAIKKETLKQGVDVESLTPTGPGSAGNTAYQDMMIRQREKPVVDTGAVPEKYGDPKTSELRRTVDASGGNDFAFEL